MSWSCKNRLVLHEPREKELKTKINVGATCITDYIEMNVNEYSKTILRATTAEYYY